MKGFSEKGIRKKDLSEYEKKTTLKMSCTLDLLTFWRVFVYVVCWGLHTHFKLLNSENLSSFWLEEDWICKRIQFSGHLFRTLWNIFVPFTLRSAWMILGLRKPILFFLSNSWLQWLVVSMSCWSTFAWKFQKSDPNVPLLAKINPAKSSILVSDERDSLFPRKFAPIK